MYISYNDWIDVIDREYLQDFIRHGGASIKFVVPANDGNTQNLKSKLRLKSIDAKYVFASVDAGSTKIHMIDKLFNEIARQIKWDELSRNFVKNLFLQNGYELPGNPNDFSLSKIAELNRREEKFLRKESQTWLEEKLFHDFEMSQEFRIAIMRLCLDQLGGQGPTSFLSNAIKEWLYGELRLISQLQQALIFQKIARHNARHMLFSLIHWLRLNGKSGLVLLIDISRYLVSTRSRNPDDGLFYTVPALLDVYEVLRQFIDGTDEMEGCLIVVNAPKDFLTDERRGLNRYDALKLRIWDEVRDRQRQNPLASMVRISL